MQQASDIMAGPEPPCNTLLEHDIFSAVLKAICAFDLPFQAQTLVLGLQEADKKDKEHYNPQKMMNLIILPCTKTVTFQLAKGIGHHMP